MGVLQQPQQYYSSKYCSSDILLQQCYIIWGRPPCWRRFSLSEHAASFQLKPCFPAYAASSSVPVTREFIELISKNLFITMTILHILADFSAGGSGITLGSPKYIIRCLLPTIADVYMWSGYIYVPYRSALSPTIQNMLEYVVRIAPVQTLAKSRRTFIK